MVRRSLRGVVRSGAVLVLGETRVRTYAALAHKSVAGLRERRHRPPPVRFVPMAALTRRRVTREGLLARRPSSVSIHEFLPAEAHEVNRRRVPIGPEGTGPAEVARERYHSAARMLARLHDVLVWPASGLVMAKPGQIITETAVAIRWGRPQLQDLPGSFQLNGRTHLGWGVAGEPPTVDGPLLLFCNNAHLIYGHWLMDCLAGIVAVRDELRSGRLAALAPPLRDWQRECLTRIGVASAIREDPNLVVRARDLMVPSFVDTGDVDAPSRAVRATFACLAAGEARRLAGAVPRLYVSRRDAPRRPMSNEAELETALAGLGFVAIQPETLSIADQVAVFATARVIVGAHGSGMANIGFAAPGCTVIEIVPSGFWGHWIERLAAVLGHSHLAIDVSTDDSAVETNAHGGKRMRDDWTYAVDVPAVVSVVRATLASA